MMMPENEIIEETESSNAKHHELKDVQNLDKYNIINKIFKYMITHT
jgi:hypothetical protein